MPQSIVCIENLEDGKVVYAASIFSGDSAKAIEHYYKILRSLKLAFPINDASQNSACYFFNKQGGNPIMVLKLVRM